MDIRPGDLVFGQDEDERYTVDRIVGSGQFGVVYEVRSEDGESRALKTIITASADQTTLQSFINEAQLATKIQHDNVVRYLFFHDGRRYPEFPPYILMEYAGGGTLEGLLEDRRSRGEQFTSDQLRALMAQLALGMKAINEVLVHRDIKPNNVLIADEVLKISDFGLSKIVGAATRARTFKGINHVKYCAPEAWRLEENTPAMDMYSMGIVFYEIATLEYPYGIRLRGNIIEAYKNAHFFQQPSDPRDYNAGLDVGMAQMILKMLKKSPEQRYSSWDDVLKRLETPATSAPSQVDIDPLVNRALETHKKSEQARLAAQEKTRQKGEYQQFVAYSFESTVVDAAHQIVEAFNARYEFNELRLQRSPLSFLIYVEGDDSPIQAKIETVYGEYDIEGQPVKAWGYVKTPEGRGFNLLLLETGADDLYGQWEAMFVTHSAAFRSPDSRPEPFPFEMHELPEEVEKLTGMHVYKTSLRPFEPDMLVELIEQIL